MKKFFMMFRNPVVSVAAAAVSIGLLAFAGIGGVRAALTTSQQYTSQISMQYIGVSLLENGKTVASRNYNSQTNDGSWTGTAKGTLLADLLKTDEKQTEDGPIIFEKKYPEVLTVQNSGRVNSYVRISIYRYWLDEKGEKSAAARKLDPSLIKLYLGDQDLHDAAVTNYGAWIKDPSATTDERVVLYYNGLLNAGSVTAAPAMDSIAIDNEIATKVSARQEGTTIITTYDYEGKQFCLEVTADAIQEHNAADAMKSAWGIDPAQIGLSVGK